MRKVKAAEIIKIVLSLLLLITCCSKDSEQKISNNSEEKIYRTAIGEPTLSMYADPENPASHTFIMNIPFKSKVEVIDNKNINRRVKIKYKDTIGYVYKDCLSEKDDLPFIENVKYNLSVHEFDYDKKSVIEALKKDMLNSKFGTGFYSEIYSYSSYKFPYYYIDNPQMFSLYGKNCDGKKIKIVAVVMNSKIITFSSRLICFIVENNELGPYADFQIEVEDEIVIERDFETLKNPDCRCQ